VIGLAFREFAALQECALADQVEDRVAPVSSLMKATRWVVQSATKKDRPSARWSACA
jgi:hypothetical protein